MVNDKLWKRADLIPELSAKCDLLEIKIFEYDRSSKYLWFRVENNNGDSLTVSGYVSINIALFHTPEEAIAACTDGKHKFT